MGYISKDIAVITEPEQISLATNPNFVVFEAKKFDDEGKAIKKQYFEVNIEVKLTRDLDKLGDRSTIRIKEPNSTEESVCTISGTVHEYDVTDTKFYVSEDITETTENIRNALLVNEWVSTNFQIKINYQVVDDKILGNIINIKSKGAGEFYNISIELNDEDTKEVNISANPLPTTISSETNILGNLFESERVYLIPKFEGKARLVFRYSTLNVTHVNVKL